MGFGRAEVGVMKKGDIFIYCIIVLFFVNGCNQKQVSEKGFLEGKISIGPICPVERIPADPKCQPTEETYRAWPIAILEGDKQIVRVDANLDGTYRIELPAGKYAVDLEKQHFGPGGSNLPAAITIKQGETTKLNIDIDTGIR